MGELYDVRTMSGKLFKNFYQYLQLPLSFQNAFKVVIQKFEGKVQNFCFIVKSVIII